MAILTLKVFAGLLQLHGPGATIQSDHPGIDALLPDLREQSADKIATSIQSEQNAPGPTASEAFLSDKPLVTEAYFRRGFVRGPGVWRCVPPGPSRAVWRIPPWVWPRLVTPSKPPASTLVSPCRLTRQILSISHVSRSRSYW